MSWQWVRRDTVFAVHDKQLAAHGGLAGVRDLNAVESALNRAPNLDASGNPPPDVADLAAAYILHAGRRRWQHDGAADG